MTALVVEVLLRVGRFDVDRGAEMAIFDMDIDVQKGDMGRGDVPGEVDGILTVELFQEVSEGVRSMGPEGRDLTNGWRWASMKGETRSVGEP